MFEQAVGYVAQSSALDKTKSAGGSYAPHTSGLALAPIYKKDWKTYNFEVAEFHIYVAGGVRVHNHSE